MPSFIIVEYVWQIFGWGVGGGLITPTPPPPHPTIPILNRVKIYIDICQKFQWIPQKSIFVSEATIEAKEIRTLNDIIYFGGIFPKYH